MIDAAEKEKIMIEVEPQEAGLRLDLFIASKLPQLSRSCLQRLIKAGKVIIAGKSAAAACGACLKPNYKVKAGEIIKVELPAETSPPAKLLPEPIPLDIIYEDEEILVINKPAGLVVHPGAGTHSGTLANALLAYFPDIIKVGSPLRPGIVHRLDKAVSGLLVVAKTKCAYENLVKQFKMRAVERLYYGIVHGEVKAAHKIIEAHLIRSVACRKKYTVSKKACGKPAKTELWAINKFKGFSLIKVKLHTGRTHQIRVHLSYVLGHPILGDDKYSRPKKLPDELKSLLRELNGIALHAKILKLSHPRTGELVEFEAPLPVAFAKILEYLQTATVK